MVREHQRALGLRRRLSPVLDENRKAIVRLYSTGAIFTREGASAGRELLLAQQNLLKARSLLERLTSQGDVPAPRSQEQLEAVYMELEQLIDKSTKLTERTGQFLARLR